VLPRAHLTLVRRWKSVGAAIHYRVKLFLKGTLMTNRYGPAYEKKRKKERELEREVLLHLRAVDDPILWETLQAYFDIHRSADVGSVLHALKDGRYIAVDGKNNVKITDLGLKRLAAGMF